ncbi:polysaccharide deacetylase family protein [Peribacillus muralis]|uniref:polysaccharide deacetylase family protein n=1 Tax=Peribacillus muralis TaxID=264697 RepID=UPI00070B9CD0|nr:polysaccharide deacetylase family protein [Peribacillus muralis]
MKKLKTIGFYTSILIVFGLIIGVASLLDNRLYSYIIIILAVGSLIYIRQKLHFKLIKSTGFWLLTILISVLSLVYGRPDLSTSFYVDITDEVIKFVATTNQTDTKETNKIEIPVFVYHMVKPNPDPQDPYQYSLEQFEKEMTYLYENGYETLTLDKYFDILEGKTASPEKSILLTFDDSTEDFYDCVFPVLQKYRMHATVFAVSSWIDDTSHLTSDEILTIMENEIDVQNHTVTHQNLKKLNREQQYEEINNASIQLEKLTGETTNVLATPFGSNNEETISIVEELGFRGAFSGIYSGISTEHSHRYQLPRIARIQNQSFDDFIRLLEFGY